MSTNDMRSHVLAAYPNDSWKRKVMAMRDDQVQAIYLSMQRRKKVKYGRDSHDRDVFKGY